MSFRQHWQRRQRQNAQDKTSNESRDENAGNMDRYMSIVLELVLMGTLASILTEIGVAVSTVFSIKPEMSTKT